MFYNNFSAQKSINYVKPKPFEAISQQYSFDSPQVLSPVLALTDKNPFSQSGYLNLTSASSDSGVHTCKMSETSNLTDLVDSSAVNENVNSVRERANLFKALEAQQIKPKTDEHTGKKCKYNIC